MSACTTVQQDLSGYVTSRPGTEICEHKWSEDSARIEMANACGDAAVLVNHALLTVALSNAKLDLSRVSLLS